MGAYELLLWTSLVSCLNANWPIYVIEEDKTAVLPCIPEGEGTVYFWTKGETFDTSVNIASRVLDIPSSVSERYLASTNGSLFIFGANKEDEGTYYCRIASESTNCHVAVTVFVQVMYEFGIDECHGSNDCVVPVDISSEIELTCSAKFVTSSMSLKWYNGSHEITHFSNQEDPTGSSLNISETIKVSHQCGSLFMCQAVDVRIGKASARNSYVRLEKIAGPEETAKSSKTWLIPTVILLVFIAIVIFFVIWFIWPKIKEKKQQQRGDPEKTTEEEMKLVQSLTGCPPGLEYLSKVDQILVHQQVEMVELLTSWASANRYIVKNTFGQQIFLALEESDDCTRQCCTPHRGFQIHFLDHKHNEVMRVSRGYVCCIHCFPCADCDRCGHLITVESPPGNPIGYVQQRKSYHKAHYDVTDENFEPKLKVRGPCCTCQTCCCHDDVEFQVLSPDDMEKAGKITKQWTGFSKECHTSADNYGITFPMDMPVKTKATLLGALFLIDFMFFERRV